MNNTPETAAVAAQVADVVPPPAAPKKATGRKQKAPRAKRTAKAAAKKATPPKGKTAARKQPGTSPREGAKAAPVVALLQRRNGATLAEIMEKTDWLRHSVRGFVAGAIKKAGYTVESFRAEGGERTYRIK